MNMPFELATVRVKLFTLSIFLILSMLLTSCSKPDPVTLGFIGGLSGRVSDLGGPARNGMLLAVEEQNALGGINGQDIQTLVKDDKQDADTAKQVVKELIDANVNAIIGPVTSSIAVNVVPLATKAKTLMVGVTVTTNALTGQDDYFVRCLAPTAVHAGEIAEFLYKQRGVRSFSAVYDLKNEAYSLSWVKDFKQRFEELGGIAQSIEKFSSGKQEALLPIASTLIDGDPDMVIFVTNAVDAALLAKLVREKNQSILLGTSEWAGTERLIELGGRHVEGAYIPQYLDRSSNDPAYQSFRERFIARFNHEPGFPGLIAYNATNMTIEQLRNKAENVELKQAIIGQGTFPGIQGKIQIDEFGDAKSKTFVTQIQNGQFVVQKR